tara:strand:- start:8 stop:1033 length:1026 start_codon:yes stop_codon:yes gene_type:complete
MFQLKKTGYFVLTIIFIFFGIIAFFAVDNNLRRSVISKVLVVHDFYRLKSLTRGLQTRDFSLLSKKLENYIEVSKKLSKGKTYMFPGIYEATSLVMSRAITQDDYNKIENILNYLIELDDRIYKLHVWYARAVSDTDYKVALNHLNKAIKISPSENEAYREALIIAQRLENNDLATQYCRQYRDSFLGGHKPLHFPTLFDSYNIQNFFLKVNSINKKKHINFIKSNISLNNEKSYEFIFSSPTNLNGFNLYFTPLAGLEIKIIQIKHYSENQEYLIFPKDLTITTNKSFILDSEDNSLKILLNQMQEEVLRLRHKDFNQIEKTHITMSIKKMNLTNSKLCN